MTTYFNPRIRPPPLPQGFRTYAQTTQTLNKTGASIKATIAAKDRKPMLQQLFSFNVLALFFLYGNVNLIYSNFTTLWNAQGGTASPSGGNPNYLKHGRMTCGVALFLMWIMSFLVGKMSHIMILMGNFVVIGLVCATDILVNRIQDNKTLVAQSFPYAQTPKEYLVPYNLSLGISLTISLVVLIITSILIHNDYKPVQKQSSRVVQLQTGAPTAQQ
jgi:hypothetical protein